MHQLDAMSTTLQTRVKGRHFVVFYKSFGNTLQVTKHSLKC